MLAPPRHARHIARHGRLSDAPAAQDRRPRPRRKRRNHPAPAAGRRRLEAARLGSPAEKVEHLLSLSLDRMAEYLSWPADGLDPYRLAAQRQVIRVVAMAAAKAGTRRLVDHEAIERFRRLMEESEARKAMETEAEAEDTRTGKARLAEGAACEAFHCASWLGSVRVISGLPRYSRTVPVMHTRLPCSTALDVPGRLPAIRAGARGC
jgi:hypothetical protein